MKFPLFSDFRPSALGWGLAFCLTGCIGLQSPSGQGPEWVGRMRANAQAKKQAQAGNAATGGSGPAGAAAGAGGASFFGGNGANGASAPASGNGSQQTSSFFGSTNGGDVPGLPQRPRYDQDSRREPIREGPMTLLRQSSVPMEAVPIDKKTGYPVRTAVAPQDQGMTLPQEYGPAGGGMAPAPVVPPPAPSVPMDPKDIKTGSRGSTFGRVRSPYPPYMELDSSGALPGSLARDPITGKVFRLP